MRPAEDLAIGHGTSRRQLGRTGLPTASGRAVDVYAESWETGRFWLSYGARKSWAFDAMYWKCLDERFFGERGHGVAKQHLWKTRIHLLTDDERAAMEPFVEAKMKAREERVIVDWDPDKAKTASVGGAI